MHLHTLKMRVSVWNAAGFDRVRHAASGECGRRAFQDQDSYSKGGNCTKDLYHGFDDRGGWASLSPVGGIPARDRSIAQANRWDSGGFRCCAGCP
jgi:hypothetical protein